jgi:outer membrane murein-binding lipoprotein Lpp
MHALGSGYFTVAVRPKQVCHPVRGCKYGASMATAEDRIGILEMRVDRLETWAGPGQVESLALGLQALRADVTAVRRVQKQHSTMIGGLVSDVSGLKSDVAELKSDVATLKSDVAELKSDVATLKSGVAEILRRLPPLSAA